MAADDPNLTNHVWSKPVTDSLFLEPEKGIQSEAGHWYQIVQLLGAGGNAVTYLVVSTSDSYRGTLFALKIFRRLSKPDRRNSFLREVKFLKDQSHPAVMRVFDEGTYKSEYPFVVAEYLPQTLYQVMRADRASAAEKISFSTQLLSSLVFLEHAEHQVIHRDVKPQNIFVKGRSCVLGDFGLMKVLDKSAEDDREFFTESVSPGMPFFYRTPDLVEYAKTGAPLTTKTDVFQLGLVLTELFTKKNPMRRPAGNDILSPIALDPIGHCPGDLGPSVASLLNRMLTLEVDRRPRASELIDGWMGLFESVCKQSRALEGRVF